MPIALSFSILSIFIFQRSSLRGSIRRASLSNCSATMAKAVAWRPRSFRQPAERRGLLAKLDGGSRAGEPFDHPTRKGAWTFGTGDACGISIGQLVMSPARFLRVGVLGHEQRHLMALVEIIEVSCAGLQKKYPRSGKVLSHQID